MTNDDEQIPRKIGYRHPPQSAQFQKGVSGNPRGRPRKPGDAATLPDGRDPTVREVIRAEINREITITDHHGRHTITAKQAVMRAMAVTALKGGVLAQRSFVEAAAKEEERRQKEKEHNFSFWLDYKESVAARIAAGGPRPKNGPDPDDIKLDWRTQEVRIEGPADEENRAATEAVCAVRDVAYEMAIYHGEALHMCDADGRVTHMGAYLGYYRECNRLLWPRFRKPPGAYDETITRRLGWRDDEWEQELKPRCEALGLPFLPRKNGRLPLLIPLAKLGIRKVIVIRPTPPARR